MLDAAYLRVSDAAKVCEVSPHTMKIRIRKRKVIARKFRQGKSGEYYFYGVNVDSLKDYPKLDEYMDCAFSAQSYMIHRKEILRANRIARRLRYGMATRPHTFSYHAHMCSPEWKRKREERILIDGGVCTICGSTHSLQCHHIKYDTLGTDEEINDIVTLCASCHKKIHSLQWD